MKINNFNKIGDTSFRVRDQLKAYSTLISYIIENNKITKDDLFDWIEKEKLYKYTNLDNKNRYSHYIFNTLKFFGIVVEEEKTYSVSQKAVDRLKENNWNFLDLFLYSIIEEGSKPNSEIKFLYDLYFFLESNRTKNIKRENVILSALVYDGTESYENLINDDNLFEKIKEKYSVTKKEKLNKLCQKNYNYITSTFIKDVFFKYKSSDKKLAFISDFLSENKRISNNSIIKNKLPIPKSFKKDPSKYIQSLSWDDKFLLISKNVIAKSLIDFKDLMSRWLQDLFFISSKNVEFFKFEDLISKNDSTDFFTPKNVEKSIKDNTTLINEFNGLYHNSDFQCFANNNKIHTVPRSAIFEYNANLVFAKRLEIPENKYNTYFGTILNADLTPSFTAPRGIPDFFYCFENKGEKYLITVETTIIRNGNSIIKAEKEPIQRHLFEYAEKRNISIHNSIVFLIVPYLDANIKNNFSYRENSSRFFRLSNNESYQGPIKICVLDFNDIVQLLADKSDMKDWILNCIKSHPLEDLV